MIRTPAETSKSPFKALRYAHWDESITGFPGLQTIRPQCLQETKTEFGARISKYDTRTKTDRQIRHVKEQQALLKLSAAIAAFSPPSRRFLVDLILPAVTECFNAIEPRSVRLDVEKRGAVKDIHTIEN